MFVGNAGNGTVPYPVFAQALEAGSLKRVENIARDMPRISLRDALRIVELIAAQDEDRYERAAVKWLGRLATEGRGVDLHTLQLASAALDALPDRPESAMGTLRGIVERYG